jgi:hypothetical protein
MAFRDGGYATVWDSRPGKTPGSQSVRISSQYRDRQTGEWKQDFSGWVSFRGEAGALAKNLPPKARIRLGECSVSSTWDRDTKENSYFFTVFTFTMADASPTKASSTSSTTSATSQAAVETIEDAAADEMPF